MQMTQPVTFTINDGKGSIPPLSDTLDRVTPVDFTFENLSYGAT